MNHVLKLSSTSNQLSHAMASTNGQPLILKQKAQALAHYPHARIAGGFIFVSGISSRRLDNTYEGVIESPDGSLTLDIRAQTNAVFKNIDEILQAAGASLENVVDLTVFLVDMKDFGAFNEIYNTFFDAETGPSRTTVAVKELPSVSIAGRSSVNWICDSGSQPPLTILSGNTQPKLLIEIKVTALAS